MTVPQRVSAQRFVFVAGGEAASAAQQGETMGEAARRHGMRRDRMSALLRDAGVKRDRWRGYDPAAVNVAVDAWRRAGTVEAVDGAARKPHEPDADGNVACGACWGIAAITNERVTRCRWCNPAGGWGG